MYILRLRAVILIVALIFFLILGAGCDEDSTTEPQGNKPTIVSFTANPSTVPVGGDSVKLSWEVSGATSLSISSGIGTVTPTDSGAITVFVSAATVFTLTASNSAGNVTTDAQINIAQSITVNGFVKDIDGEPISGVTVIVKGENPTTTGAGGSFSIADVTVPYEIRIIISTQQSAIVYQGLTRSDPTLYYFSSTTQSKFATITGTVPPAQGKTTMVFFISGTKAWWSTAHPTTGSYSINADWRGTANSYTGKLQVLRWTTNNITGLPEQYDAYGSEDNLTISDGGTFSNHNFTEADFTDPAEQNISGSIIRPSSNYSIDYKYLLMNFGNATIQLSSQGGVGLTDNFSYIVPAITGATFEVDAQAQVSALPNNRVTFYRKKGITGGSSGISVNLESAPQLNLPTHNGTGIDTTTQFLWTQGSGIGVNLVRIMPTIPPGPQYYILTAGNTTYIPDLSPQGMGLPSNVGYGWSIVKLVPFSSLDEAASATFIPVINGYVEGGSAISETFNFTSHP
ncbi:MAG: hypothetical protein DRQ13_10090 [Ignavibacteriae bacterium]|nr:MAG: hypothetical protein DRQ13_10090 [Ignavibacteriota bacterium]